MALQDRFRRSVGLLQIDAPIFQFFQRNRGTRDGAADECARAHHAKFAVEVFDFGLTGRWRGSIEPIEHFLASLAEQNRSDRTKIVLHRSG